MTRLTLLVTLLALATTTGCQRDVRDVAAACPRCEPQATCAPVASSTAALAAKSTTTTTADVSEPVASVAVPLDLPPPRPSPGAPGIQPFLSVDIDARGNCWIDGAKAASCDDVDNAARAAIARNPEVRATIRADAATTHGSVMRVLDLLKQGGINRIAFAVRP